MKSMGSCCGGYSCVTTTTEWKRLMLRSKCCLKNSPYRNFVRLSHLKEYTLTNCVQLRLATMCKILFIISRGLQETQYHLHDFLVVCVAVVTGTCEIIIFNVFKVQYISTF